jgi:hypothetical protein
MTADPTLAAGADILDDALVAMRAVVEGASPDLLNRRPAGDDTNPIAVLVMHALSSARWWLCVAVGAALPDRDRDAEFRYVATDTDELLRFVDAVSEDCRALLATDDAFEAGAIMRSRRIGGDEDVSAAWALIHSLEHLGGHVAHAQLTRQVQESATG